MEVYKMTADEDNYLIDDYYRLTIWLNRYYPNVINEYKEYKEELE